MITELTYKNFIQLSPLQQVNFLDDFKKEVDIPSISPRKLRRFFEDLIHENNLNEFIKGKSIDLFVGLTLDKIIKKDFAYNIILEIEYGEEEYVLVSQIKSLFLLDVLKEDTSSKLSQLKGHHSREVASEAYFKYGMMLFFKQSDFQNNVAFLTDVKQAKLNFESALEVDYNRLDAKLYYQICELLLNVIENKQHEAKILLEKIADTLWNFQIQSIDLSIPEIDLQLFNLLNKIVKFSALISEPEYFLNIQESYQELCNLNYAILAYQDEKHIVYRHMLKQWQKNIQKNVLNPYIELNLSAKIKQIKHLVNQLKDSDKDLKIFLETLLFLLNNQEKKKEISIPTLADLARLLPSIPPTELVSEYNKASGSEIERIFSVFKIYYLDMPNILGKKQENKIEREILNNLRIEILEKIPKYNKATLAKFLNVVKYIIRYQINSSKKRPPFNVLYDNTSLKEADYQNSLYDFLKASDIYSFIEDEKPGYADNGRIDIVYNDGEVSFPIEIKKTKRKQLNDTVITNNYIGQAQTYTYPHFQLGIFVLFYIQADNQKNIIMNDIRSLFRIYRVPPKFRFTDNYPNYVIGAIIPANRKSPSAKSTYG